MPHRSIETNNYEGIRTIFTESQIEKKADKHPELRQDDFLTRVQCTIERPDFVYQDMEKSDYQVYYSKEVEVNSRTRYTKVVVHNNRTHCFVVTAYRPDYVKERGKTKLLFLWNNL
jgi:hypothetical protein